MEVYGDNRAPDEVLVDAKGGSLAERRASKRGRSGFNIATARCSSGSSMVRSPFLTIPPGFSPTVLLDPPTMLLNTHDLPSPTTGTFPIHSIKDGDSLLNPVMLEDGSSYGSEDSYFKFTPHGELRVQNQEASALEHEMGSSTDNSHSLPDAKIVNGNCDSMGSCPSSQQQHPLEAQHKGSNAPTGPVETTEDGYNWRKYGQKQVKGSEYPRSYFKCTHTNCTVKKKVERSIDGQITEIIYTGGHHHARPDPNRRAVLRSAKVAAGRAWRKTQYGVKDGVDGLERTSSVSVVTELSDPLLNPLRKTVGAYESAGTPELSSTLGSHDDDDRTTQGSISACIEADDAEPEFKRRRKEGGSMETSLGSRSVREQRVVLQIETEFDILEDGYRWRKYGQKVVKGNPNPRSYYKCTSAGCSVRKHVERASHDLKCVITTYEGKHTHLVPAARNSSNAQSSASQAPPTMGSSRNSNVPKPETQIQDLSAQFYPSPEFSHDYQRSGCFDMKLGPAPSFCQLKFPPLQNTLPYSSFGLNSKHTTATISGSFASVVSDFPISLPLSQNLSAFQVFLAGQQLRETDIFLTPKQEHEDDNIYASFQPITDTSSGSSSSSVSSVYQQIMGNFP